MAAQAAEELAASEISKKKEERARKAAEKVLQEAALKKKEEEERTRQRSQSGASQVMVKLYKIKGDVCSETSIQRKEIGPFTLARSGYNEGACADMGFTELEFAAEAKQPILGDITVNVYKKPGTVTNKMAAAEAQVKKAEELAQKVKKERSRSFTTFFSAVGLGTSKAKKKEGTSTAKTGTQLEAGAGMVTLYKIKGDECRETIVKRKDIGPITLMRAKYAEGSCADMGYTELQFVAEAEQPVLGSIEMTVYKRPDAMLYETGGGLSARGHIFQMARWPEVAMLTMMVPICILSRRRRRSDVVVCQEPLLAI
eukprot:gnl/TRDRNA2_/TRDRNA2_164109_c0_seq3.p1 gnl/TRDRNA2_/TRDRNA2_164109_c0~~gnl/TRDRNA2_/TRDRNA2_164109_c0_seq3.p1  ORF type:complete len:364 (+),score=94.79 gnl/TRDRNA2_/TRDRNA2_164109_c0_seq3:155-1093(+)